MQWYFLSDTQEQIPIQESHIAGLVQTGVVDSNTMIWKEGMDEWVKCGEIKPELFAQRNVVPIVGDAATARQSEALHAHGQVQVGSSHAGPATAAMQLGDGQTVREAAQAIASASVWMKIVAIFTIIFGFAQLAQAAIFIVHGGASADNELLGGLITGGVAAIPAVIFILLGKILFQSAADAREAAITAQKSLLVSALNDLARYFRITGILILVAFGIVLIGFALVFFGIGMLLLSVAA